MTDSTILALERLEEEINQHWISRATEADLFTALKNNFYEFQIKTEYMETTSGYYALAKGENDDVIISIMAMEKRKGVKNGNNV